MSKIIKVGGIDIEVPDDSPLAYSAGNPSPTELQADKPETPEKQETLPWVYRPNDPFQASVDRVVALGNVHEAKPWVRKAFMWIFLIIPIAITEIRTIDVLLTSPEGQKLKDALVLNAIGFVACAPYLLIWVATARHKKKSGAKSPR